MVKFKIYIHGSNCKINDQLTTLKLTLHCFLYLEGTRGVVHDLNNIFECEKWVLGNKTQKFMILKWYWEGNVFYPIALRCHTYTLKILYLKTLLCQT